MDRIVKSGSTNNQHSVTQSDNRAGRINNHVVPLKTEATQSFYLHRAKNILLKIESQTGSNNISPIDIAEWLDSASVSLSRATVRQYRACLVFYIETQVASGIFPKLISDSAIEIMKLSGGQVINSGRTSSTKSKSIPQDKINALIDRLESKSSRFARSASLMFQSSIIAGLRPIEWLSASLSKDDLSGDGHLLVQNAKATNNRSFGESRVLIIPRGDSLNTVERTIRCISDLIGMGFTWETIYNESRRMILVSKIKHNGKFISLYTARHQFTANMKNVYSKEEVALLLGHGSTETAGEHYGRRVSGHPEYKNLARLKRGDSPTQPGAAQ